VAVAKILRIDPREPESRLVEESVEVLRTGGVLAYPTETFYGLGVDGRSRSGCARIFDLKGRPPEKALPCIVSGLPQLEDVARDLGKEALFLARRFWPGPLTLVVSAKPGLAAASPEGTIAVRASGLPLPRALARALGGPLTATSANRSGPPPATTAEMALRDIGSGIDLILDGGPCPGGLPSTIVDVRERAPRLVREGRIPFEEIERLLKELSPP
jgi:L-threonylcarbamoyladenylate synthase